MLLSYPITGSAKSACCTLLNVQQLVAAGACGGHNGYDIISQFPPTLTSHDSSSVVSCRRVGRVAEWVVSVCSIDIIHSFLPLLLFICFFFLFVCLTRTKHRSCPIQCLFAAFIISFIFKPDTVIIENPKSQFIFKVKSSADHNVKKYLTHVFMLLWSQPSSFVTLL